MTEIMNVTDAQKTALIARRVDVHYATKKEYPGSGAGWYYSIGGMFLEGPFPTDNECWHDACVRTCLIIPGETIYTSKKYGLIASGNVVCPSGNLGTSRRYRREEVREIAGGYRVFTVWSREIYDAGEIVDEVAYQYQQDAEIDFSDQNQAITFIEALIGDYESTEAEEVNYAASVQAELSRVSV